MCGSKVDIQSATAEIRRRKKEERRNKPQGKNIRACPIPYGGHNKRRFTVLHCSILHCPAVRIRVHEIDSQTWLQDPITCRPPRQYLCEARTIIIAEGAIFALGEGEACSLTAISHLPLTKRHPQRYHIIAAGEDTVIHSQCDTGTHLMVNNYVNKSEGVTSV